MITRKKVTITGIGTIIMAGVALLAIKYHAYRQVWRKEQLDSAYYKSSTEEDIAWG